VKNIATGVTSKVYSTNQVQFNPIISGNTIVWSQENAAGNFYIYRKDLVTGKVSKVA
jgi:hypothetical protein